ncbi:(2Fe-2S)-binding protein [Roseivivax sediminis]|uniref:2Fe-2S iron-sulfur cluster binding domain-containing protein n=1 Tax=Roseivivax sediminis TaxID=936889 RepID=A0A1I1T9N6_9RHOB|nr:(2Fe-2S)-binding protein [Roseivivax sediminis]SFD55332.1 2Fe-2S iron-sulfur cluster binding domain-containing protein [Roseivivax sediminis]
MSRFVRLAEQERPTVRFRFDGEDLSALVGDTVLTAVLCARDHLRPAEFGSERRAGFCLMGACQDCWLWQEGGARLRACTTPVAEGMRLRSTAPMSWPERSE